ncbi:MAG: hypothetical protein IJ809_03755, partial [Clostridia bacterium]|nr:hypothetical protein [Clostridia bacterium]
LLTNSYLYDNIYPKYKYAFLKLESGIFAKCEGIYSFEGGITCEKNHANKERRDIGGRHITNSCNSCNIRCTFD